MKSIFVSSTFKDMQAERDMLHTVVLPEIKDYAENFNQSVGFSDLRWGVNTLNLSNYEGARKVLSVCLNEIDRCKPYMIIFIGERYGWIPDAELIRDTVNEKQYITDDLEKSVTALEIEYGALSKADMLDNCLFYFRNPLPIGKMSDENKLIFSAEDMEYKKKLDSLKDKIIKAGSNIKYYDAMWDETKQRIVGLETLAKDICDSLKQLLERDFIRVEHKTWQEAEINSAWNIILEHNESFTGREELIKDISKQILQNGNNLILVDGKSGSGKTSIFSKACMDSKQSGFTVIPILCGTKKSSSLEDILSQICYELEVFFGITKHFTANDYRDKTFQFADEIEELIEDNYTKATKILIAIDGLEKIAKSIFLEELSWLPRYIYENLKIFITYDSDKIKLSEDSQFENYTYSLTIPALTIREEKALVQSIVSTYHKELPNSIIEAICNHNDIDVPLYYSLLVQRLLMMNSEDFAEIRRRGDDMNAINSYMLDYISRCPDSIRKMAIAVLIEAADRINADITKCILPVLSIVKYGLREHDLEKLCDLTGVRFSHLDFVRFMKYMKPFFTINSDGYIYISNKEIKKGLYDELVVDTSLQNELFNYLKNQPDNNVLYYFEALRLSRKLNKKEFLLEYFSKYNHKKLLNDFYMFEELRRSTYEVLGYGDYLYHCLEEYADINLKSADNYHKLYNAVMALNILGVTLFYNAFSKEEKQNILLSIQKLYNILIDESNEDNDKSYLYNSLATIYKALADDEKIIEEFELAGNYYKYSIDCQLSFRKYNCSCTDYEFDLRMMPTIIDCSLNYAECLAK